MRQAFYERKILFDIQQGRKQETKQMLNQMIHAQNEILWTREEKESEIEEMLMMEMEERYSENVKSARYLEVCIL